MLPSALSLYRTASSIGKSSLSTFGDEEVSLPVAAAIPFIRTHGVVNKESRVIIFLMQIIGITFHSRDFFHSKEMIMIHVIFYYTAKYTTSS